MAAVTLYPSPHPSPPVFRLPISSSVASSSSDAHLAHAQGGDEAGGEGDDGEEQQELDLQAVAQLFGWRVSEGPALCDEEGVTQEDSSRSDSAVARLLQEF